MFSRIVRPILAEMTATAPAGPQTWVMIVGCAFLGLAVLFLIVLVIANVMGRTIPHESRSIIVIIVALCLGVGAGFLGDYSKLSGDIPVPFVSSHPLAFDIGGGGATVLIVWVLGFYLYVRPSRSQELPEEFSASYPEGTLLSEAIKQLCANRIPPYGVRFEPDITPFETRRIAAGEVRGSTIVDLIARMTNHLAQGSAKINATVTQPPNQAMIIVKVAQVEGVMP